MSARGAIPPIIRDILQRETGYVLLITGNPGTGKSLLVQEILRAFDTALLILTNNEDISHSTDDNIGQISEWDKRHVLVHYWRSLTGELDFQSSLLDQLKNLSGGVDLLVDSDIIMIDSWTDFLHPFSEKRKYELQQSLMHAARNESKKLILVAEGMSGDIINEHLYHATDAILRLQKHRENQRMYRQLLIEKMRYVPLLQDVILFTLERGRFTFIPWYQHQYPAITVERDPILDPSEDIISTGNRSLDSVLHGGFRRGALSLVEVDNLAAPYLETVYIPFISNHLQLKRPAVIVLPEGWSPERFTSGLTKFVNRENVSEQVVFFGRHALGKKLNVRSLDDDPWKTLQEIRYEASQLERKFNQRTTELFALDTLENKYGHSTVKGMLAEISAALPETDRVVATILSKHQEIKSEAISPNTHLVVHEIGGVLTIAGIIPRTGLLSVRPILTGGFLDYELIPMV